MFVAILLGCGNVNKSKESKNNEQVTTQQSMLLGKFEKADLMQEPYATWFPLIPARFCTRPALTHVVSLDLFTECDPESARYIFHLCLSRL